MSSLGFLTMAFGPDRYTRQAEALARSLKLHMPGIPLAVITDRDMSGTFDICVPKDSSIQPGVILKLDIYKYSPFEETLFVDSDSLVSRPFFKELDEIRKFEFSPVVARFLGLDGEDWFIEDVGKALTALNAEKFPKFNGGVYFFRKGTIASRVFQRAAELVTRKKELGLRDFDSAGPNDETLIGLALANLGIYNLYNDGGNLMRTPLSIIGNLRIDVLGGGCRFNKGGEIVSPAICHFCGPWVQSAQYRMAVKTLLTGRKQPIYYRAYEHSRELVVRASDKIRRKASWV